MLRASPEEHIEAVERALELGVNGFDTSPDYGKEAAERNFAQALREVRAGPGEPVPRWRFCLDIWTTSPGAINKSIDASLKRLGVDYVDMSRDSQQPGFGAVPRLCRWGWVPRCRWRTTFSTRERWRG